MKAMFDSIKRFVREEDGAAGVEYALLLCLVAVVIGTMVAAMSGSVRTILTTIQTGLANGATAATATGG